MAFKVILHTENSFIVCISSTLCTQSIIPVGCHVSNYFYWCNWPEALLCDVEHNMLAIATYFILGVLQEDKIGHFKSEYTAYMWTILELPVHWVPKAKYRTGTLGPESVCRSFCLSDCVVIVVMTILFIRGIERIRGAFCDDALYKLTFTFYIYIWGVTELKFEFECCWNLTDFPTSESVRCTATIFHGIWLCVKK